MPSVSRLPTCSPIETIRVLWGEISAGTEARASDREVPAPIAGRQGEEGPSTATRQIGDGSRMARGVTSRHPPGDGPLLAVGLGHGDGDG
jgi:hypothetical protein